jgi:uncharacterized protein
MKFLLSSLHKIFFCRCREMNHEERVRLASEFVRADLAGNDSSHDFFHIERVRKLALSLAQEEGKDLDLEVVELAALLHDVKDWKYSGSEHSGADAVGAFLKDTQCPVNQAAAILHIVANIGFKTELGAPAQDVTLEFAVVQDADRLDAIGAIGIARCMTFGGARNRVLYDPAIPPVENISKEAYVQNTSTTMNHFYEKLLKLKGLMKSTAGRKRAEQRHEFMLQYLRQFDSECAGEK